VSAAGRFTVTLLNQAGSSFGLLQGGGTSSSFPAWKRSSATWVARLADDTANAVITVGNILVVASTGDAVFQVDSSAGGANDINGMLIKRGGNNKWQILNNLAGSSTDEFTIRHAATNTVVVQITKDTAYETTFTAGAVKSTHATAGLGYGTGAGGTVVQGAGSGKATGVTLNKSTGEITMNNATLNAATTVSFTLTNSAIAATDLILIWHVSAGTLGSYAVTATPASGSASIAVRNITAGNLGEAIVLKFAVFKAATS